MSDIKLTDLTKPWKRQRCSTTGKWGYPHRKEAQACLESMNRQGTSYREGFRLNVYQCADCGLWHVGHTWVGP